MRKIIMSLNVTPDGFCDHTNVIADDELHEDANELFRGADTLIFGRKTFELMESAWPEIARTRASPTPMVEFADLINGIEKIVYSRTLKHTEWQNTTILDELIPEDILKLKQQPGKDILVGGPDLVSTFSKLGLIDEYYFIVHPMIGGKGKRFFEHTQLGESIRLELMDIRKFKSGAVKLKYREIEP